MKLFKRKLFIGIFLYILISFSIFEIGTHFYTKANPNYDIEMWRYWTQLKQRASDPLMSHEHIPGQSADFNGVNIKINSKGLRDREFDYLKKENTRRILFLGDSLTLGWGVAFKSIFTKLLEKSLTKQDNIPTEVINTGVGNYNSEQEYTFYKNFGFKYNPDITMLLYFINDAEPTPIYKDSIFMEKSIFVVFLWSQLNKIWAKFEKKKKFISYYRQLYIEGSESWSKSKKSLLGIKNLVNKNKKNFIVAICPELRVFKNSYPFEEEHKKILNFLKKSKIYFIDLLPIFKNKVEREESIWVSHEDSHPNALGHKIIAKGIENYFKNNPKKLRIKSLHK